MSNQGDRQAAYRAVTGKALSANGDLIAYANSLGITGTYNECIIQLVQSKLSSTETNINSLMAEAAADRGKVRWTDLTSDVTSLGAV